MPKQSNKTESELGQLNLFNDVKPQAESGELKIPENCWLTVAYQPVSLFSLKRSDATSMAARSNLVPTPCTIKMTLLKVLIESQGNQHRNNFESWIQHQFTWIRDLKIYIQPPERLVVNRNGYKLRYVDQQADKDYRQANDKQPPPVMPMQDGYVFREWVYLEGNLRICCGETKRLKELEALFMQINTFGKRGCFFQYLPKEKQDSSYPQFQTNSYQGFTIQPMDDFGNKTTFSRINPFSEDKAKLGKDRVITSGLLPLKLAATSARYDLYIRE
jgi:hypothetical protein